MQKIKSITIKKPTFLKKKLLMAIPFMCVKVIKINSKTFERYVEKIIYKRRYSYSF
ncbi:hypothetical protein HMPREF1143_1429 [Peptoanaerobacter stomatis]|uniref:Uncharacterized protein n=1 Tax=Peptoanaerobacter stomatis TaxID=796937 RepID=J5WSV1_9FIRM|nr:hypothetical protein HMPREF1143_1429 [Peptoanaerobacter stomatis]